MKWIKARLLVAVLCVLVISASAQAMVVVEIADGIKKARATFDIVGGNLTVLLENTSSFDIPNPSHVLTGVFFGIQGFSGALTPVSAMLTSAGVGAVMYPTAQDGTWTPGTFNVSSEWAYTNTVSGAPMGANNIITAAGLGLVGPDDRFGTGNLAGPIGVDGLQYGIVSEGYTGDGNAAVTGQFALINTDVLFTLSGLPGGFTLDDIFGVSFQYGTDFRPDGKNVIPAPPAALLAALGLGLVGAVRRRLV